MSCSWEVAKSGRAKCKEPHGCGEKIEEGVRRVGVERFQGGRMATDWIHGTCFVQNIKVDVADSNRGKCKVSKMSFVKGKSLRICWKSDVHKTTGAHVWSNCLVEHVSETIIPDVLSAHKSFCLDNVPGMAELSTEDQKRVRSALTR